MKKGFVCPECGSREIGRTSNAPIPRPNHRNIKAGSWSSEEFFIITCNNCRRLIPGFLGFLDNAMSIEDAQKYWKKDFRERDIYLKNIYSQFGEDGIVEEILNRIGEKNCDKFCIEFGAGNGISSSNTYNLIRNKDYKALLIEPNKKAYKKLCTNIPSNDIIKINKNVTFSGANSLDKILDSHNINTSFDFLSIDIDGCDYFIFESLKNYKPKIICIEFNPTIPNEVIFIQKRDMNIKQASSARALVELANKKDYSLFSSTYCNLLFVSNELKEKVLGKKDNSLNAIRDDSYCKNYVFTGQDGTIFTSKKIILRNHFLELEVDDLQLLPKILLKYPGDYNFFQRILYKFFRIFYFLRYPRLFFKKINPISNKKILKTFYTNIFKKDIW